MKVATQHGRGVELKALIDMGAEPPAVAALTAGLRAALFEKRPAAVVPWYTIRWLSEHVSFLAVEQGRGAHTTTEAHRGCAPAASS